MSYLCCNDEEKVRAPSEGVLLKSVVGQVSVTTCLCVCREFVRCRIKLLANDLIVMNAGAELCLFSLSICVGFFRQGD